MLVVKTRIYNLPSYVVKLNPWEKYYWSLRFFASEYLIERQAYTQIQEIRKLSTPNERIKATFDYLKKFFFGSYLRFFIELALVYFSPYSSLMINFYLKLKSQEIGSYVPLKQISLLKNFSRIFHKLFSPIQLFLSILLFLEILPYWYHKPRDKL